MSILMNSGELHTCRIIWFPGTTALLGHEIDSELKHISRGNGGIGKPDFILKGHVELGSQTDCIEEDGVSFHFSISKVVHLRKENNTYVHASYVVTHKKEGRRGGGEEGRRGGGEEGRRGGVYVSYE